MAIGGDIRDTFFQECEELLEALNDGLDEIDSNLSAGTVETETVNAVFRAVHSIKGGAGAFGLEELVRFAHGFENLLDAMRAGRIAAEPEVMAVCHRASDRLSDLVLASRDDLPLDPATNATLLAALQAALSQPTVNAPPSAETAGETEDGFAFTPSPVSLDLPAADPDAEFRGYRILFSPLPGLYANGNDTVLLFRALAELGTLEVAADRRRLPQLEDYDWQESYIDWQLVLQ
ncbi:chemotaxis protein CheA, partial [Thioclava sp. BHET1]